MFLNLIFRTSNIEYIQTLMPYCIELAMLTFNNIKYVFTILFKTLGIFVIFYTFLNHILKY